MFQWKHKHFVYYLILVLMLLPNFSYLQGSDKNIGLKRYNIYSLTLLKTSGITLMKHHSVCIPKQYCISKLPAALHTNIEPQRKQMNRPEILLILHTLYNWFYNPLKCLQVAFRHFMYLKWKIYIFMIYFVNLHYYLDRILQGYTC